MPFNELLQKLEHADPPIQKETLFMNMVYAGYADLAASNAPEDDSNSTGGQDPDLLASGG